MKKKRRKKKKIKLKKQMGKCIFIILIGITIFFGYKNDNIGKIFKKNIKVPGLSKIEKKIEIFIREIRKIIPIEKEQYRVLYVSDGDTISVKKIINGEKSGDLIKIRLFGIDAPETSQDYGYESKMVLMSMVKDKNIEIENRGKDRYDRVLAIVYHEKNNINEEMVKQGHAWWYEEYDKNNEKMKKYQENARKNRLGLFVKKGYMPPWEFRNNRNKLKK